MVIESLSALLSEGLSKSSLKRALSAFECKRDTDVESFLRRYALANETSGASRTYLVLDEDQLAHGYLVVVAVLSLAMVVTDYSRISAEERREILGPVPHLSTSEHFPGYLLAQLARSDTYTHEDFDCHELLVFAERKIREAISRIGGSMIYLDCKEPLIGYYEAQGYEVLYLDDNGLYKLYKVVDPLTVQ